MVEESLFWKARFYHVDHWELIILPNSINYWIFLIKDPISFELILPKASFISFSVLKVLNSSAIKHSVMPCSFVFFVASIPEQNSLSTLQPIFEIALVPAAVWPPKSTSSISFASLELPFIQVWLLTRPFVKPSSILLVHSEFSNIVVASRKIQLCHSFQLTIVEVSLYNFMCIFEEACSFSMRSIHLCFSNVNNFLIFKVFWCVEGWLIA